LERFVSDRSSEAGGESNVVQFVPVYWKRGKASPDERVAYTVSDTYSHRFEYGLLTSPASSQHSLIRLASYKGALRSMERAQQLVVSWSVHLDIHPHRARCHRNSHDLLRAGERKIKA
jgi:hypothetical protein